MGNKDEMTTTTQNSLQQHPLSAAFPSMPEAEIDALAMDVEKNGQREPAVLFEGMVLDGWHRYIACTKAGVEFKAAEFDGDDPVSFVISKNLHRRHLTSSQRAAAVVATSTWRPAGRHISNQAPSARLTSNAEMARAAEVSERTIKDAKVAHQAGLGDAVREGQVSAKDAARIAKGESPQPKPKAVVANREVEKLYEAVKAELAEVKEKNDALAEVARELNDKLEAFETTEPDEQQKLIADLQLKLRRKEAEIDRLRVQIRDANNKNNELIRTVKRLQKNAG
jgi:hypothetical protein